MKVLIIEDDLGVQNALSRGFNAKNVIVDSVRDGKEALKIFGKNVYDLAIVDLMLPNIDGEKIIKKIRDVGISTPVLVLTALRKTDTKARLLEAGADDFLEKPFSFEELYARASAILRRKNKGVPTQHLKVGDLELIPEKRMAKRKDKLIRLRGKEYALLSYLMQHPNKIISRQTLVENVWGYSISVLSNTIDSHISNLRRKIDKDFTKKLIRTMHGMGYMITADE